MEILKRLKDQVVSSRIEEEAFYEAALHEIENGGRRSGLWAKALSSSSGNLDEAKATYLKLLVVKLRDEAHIIERLKKEQDIAIEKAEQEHKEVKRREESRRKELEAIEAAKKQKRNTNNNWFWWAAGVVGIAFFIVVQSDIDQTSKSPSTDGANKGGSETRRSMQNDYSAIDGNNLSQGTLEYDRVVSYLLERYPELDTDHPSFNEFLNNKALEAKDGYIARGYGDVEAVLFAVHDIFGDLLKTENEESGSSESTRTRNPYPECELKGIMSDDDYRRCGLEPPGVR